jgi:hypothetical protein
MRHDRPLFKGTATSLDGDQIKNVGAPTDPNDAARLQDIGSGFYGVIFKETEAGGAVFLDDQLNVDSNFFYLSSDGSDKPILSFSSDLGEDNTASSLGGDQTLVGTKSGVDLPFKGLTAGDNITLSSDSNSVTIAGEVGIEDIPPGFYGIIVKDDSTTVKTDSILFPTADFTVDAFEDGARVQLASAGGGGGFYGVIFKESEAGGSLFRDDTFVVNSNHFYLTSAGDDEKPLLNLIHDTDEKSLSFRWPSRDSTVSWFVPSSDIIVEKIHANLLAKDSGFYPYVDWSVYFDTLRTHDGGTELITGGTRTGFYPATNAHTITSFDNPNIPSDNYVWFRTTDLGEGNGAEEEIHLTMHFRRN